MCIFSPGKRTGCHIMPQHNDEHPAELAYIYFGAAYGMLSNLSVHFYIPVSQHTKLIFKTNIKIYACIAVCSCKPSFNYKCIFYTSKLTGCHVIFSITFAVHDHLKLMMVFCSSRSIAAAIVLSPTHPITQIV